jgi:hypothetical protein
MIIGCYRVAIESPIRFPIHKLTYKAFCEISKPRHWYPDFRGGVKTNYSTTFLYLCYVVDCEAVGNKGNSYQEELYREFHGMLGEAKESVRYILLTV